MTATLAMAGGLAAGYGTLAALAGRYLYPAGPAPRGWMFVSEVARLAPGQSVMYRSPSGAPVSVTRQGGGASAEDFIALSTVCPHLGCQVHWEPQNNRYFCPCHNGVFDPSGMGTSGPPKGQPLARYPLKIENGLLFIEVPTDTAAASAGKASDRAVAQGGCGPCGRSAA